MKTRALYALAAMALCLTLVAGVASASGATANLTVSGGLTGSLQISGAPPGLYTVHEFTGAGYVLVGSGLVGESGASTTQVTLIPTSNPSFQVRLRTTDGLVVIAAAISPDPVWWWDL